MKAAKPQNDRIIVQPDAPEDTTDYGMVIPDESRERTATGVIVAIGPEVNVGCAPGFEIVPGMRVCYNEFGVSRAKVAGQEVAWIRKLDINFSYEL